MFSFLRREKWTRVNEKMGDVRIYNELGTVDKLVRMLVVLEKSDKGNYRAYAEESDGRRWRLSADFTRVDFFGVDKDE